jgi:hypothetical protein
MRENPRSGGSSAQPAVVAFRRMKCTRCDDCGWLCENHTRRPSLGNRACDCGWAGTPCLACNTLDDEDDPPRPPEGFKISIDKDTGGIEGPAAGQQRQLQPYDHSKGFEPANMPLTTIRVLLVDDEIMIRMTVADLVEQARTVGAAYQPLTQLLYKVELIPYVDFLAHQFEGNLCPRAAKERAGVPTGIAR